MPGVLGVWTGADLNAAGYGPLKTADPGAQPRRLADEDADALFARHRQGALRRRSGGLRRRRDAGRGQGRGRGGRARHRGAARRHRRARGGPARRARSCSTTCRAMSASTTTTATRQGRRGLRQGRARHAAAPDQQPHRRLRHGAALGDRPTTTRRPTATRFQRRQPGRVRPQAPDGRSCSAIKPDADARR